VDNESGRAECRNGCEGHNRANCEWSRGQRGIWRKRKIWFRGLDRHIEQDNKPRRESEARG